jgi:hypothetical protein
MNRTALVGWRPSPNERGTIDLVWSCLLVIFTAVRTVIYLNLPAKNDGLRTILVRQMRWIIFAILAPDMITSYSAAQWASAKRSVLQMLSLGHKNRTLEHAFYADSGGFWLDPTDYPSFPVKASSIYYLVKENYIPCLLRVGRVSVATRRLSAGTDSGNQSCHPALYTLQVLSALLNVAIVLLGVGNRPRSGVSLMSWA